MSDPVEVPAAGGGNSGLGIGVAIGLSVSFIIGLAALYMWKKKKY